MVAAVEKVSAVSWLEANHAYLQTEMRRLRMLFARRVRWLRWNWQRDPLGSNHHVVISDAVADRLLRGDDEIEELRFYSEDAECVSLSAAFQEIEADLANRRQQLTDAGNIPALEALVRSFGLKSIERDLLILCFAIENEPAFATLAAYVQDNINARYATLDLVLSVLCRSQEEREAAREALLATSPLRHFKLVRQVDGEGDTVRGLQTLRLDERVSDYIRGNNRLHEGVARLCRPVASNLVAGVHRELIDELCRYLRAAHQPWPLFHLTGSEGSGKLAVAAQFAARANMQLYRMNARYLPVQADERHELLLLMEREVLLSRFALYLDVTEVDSADRTFTAVVRDWIERAGGIIFVGAHERWQFNRPVRYITIPKLNAETQCQLWRESLQGTPNSVGADVDAIVQQFDFGPTAIPRVIATATARARGRAEEFKLQTEDLWEACREQVAWKLGTLAQRLVPCYGWDDIVLPEDQLSQLREIADQVATRGTVYETWNFGSRLPRGRGIGALFSGPSGTGKTMAAEILARHLKLDLYRIDLAGVVSKYIGETEKNLRNVFDAAEQSGAILFFDEADALFGKRSEVRDSHDRYANIEVNYLLQRMEDYRGLAILCTNRRSALDRAFLRRLRFLVEFPFPDSANRRLIWTKVFPAQAPQGELDWEALARLEITGGSIRNIALNAAFLAAGEQTNIQMNHIAHAARREYSKIDKLLTESEFGLHLNSEKA